MDLVTPKDLVKARKGLQIFGGKRFARVLFGLLRLDMINEIVKEQFADLKNSPFTAGSEITKYFEMLPDYSELKMKYNEMMSIEDVLIRKEQQEELRESIYPGSIDVNIMTKLDKANYNSEGGQLASEFNDAHAALRGFAKGSSPSSSLCLFRYLKLA